MKASLPIIVGLALAFTLSSCQSTGVSTSSPGVEAEASAVEHAHASVVPVLERFMFRVSNVKNLGTDKNALKSCQIDSADLPRPYSYMEIGRTSHKLRNPENTPRDWMKPYLEKFSGKTENEVPSHVLVHLNGGRVGYLEPLFVDQVCLKCHGSQLTESVEQQLETLYPQDEATGFRKGEFRGMIWLEFMESDLENTSLP